MGGYGGRVGVKVNSRSLARVEGLNDLDGDAVGEFVCEAHQSIDKRTAALRGEVGGAMC